MHARAANFGPMLDTKPALLFSATHGLTFTSGHPHQIARQGALLCDDWPGSGRMTPASSVGATEIATRLDGAAVFAFGCHTAGVPEFDRSTLGAAPQRLAPTSFVAALPQQLLRRGAVAVIGHVERVYSTSFVDDNEATAHLQPFERAFECMLQGLRIGGALRGFHARYVRKSITLVEHLAKLTRGFAISPAATARLWLERNDAEGFTLLGDPAAQLLV
jgi:hypothetical protein